MAAQSKTVDDAQLAKEQALVGTVQKAALLLAFACGILVPARGPLVLQLKKGDTVATAKLMGLMSTCAAAVELLLNPILGRLSDKYGRRPFVIACPAIAAFMHALVFVNPTSLVLNFVNRCISGAMLFAFINPMTSAIQDTFVGDMAKIGQTSATIGAGFGVGFALGPLVGSKLPGRKAFAASSLGYLAVSAFMHKNFQETLALEKRKEFDLFASNPLSFLRLFKTKTMSMLAAACACNSMADYANIYDVNFLFLKTVLGYGQEQIGQFAGFFGLTQIAGGLLAKQLIGSIGLQAYTLAGNLGYAIGFAMLGSTKTQTQLYLALSAFTVGHQRGSEASGLLGKLASETGMGTGEVVGATTNLAAVLKMIAPLLYSRVFTLFTTNGRNVPGMPYFTIVGFVLAALALVSSVPGRVAPAPVADKKE